MQTLFTPKNRFHSDLAETKRRAQKICVPDWRTKARPGVLSREGEEGAMGVWNHC